MGNKLKIHCGWDLEFDLNTKHKTELFVDFHNFKNRMPNSKKLLLLLEPEEILASSAQTIQTHEMFEYIFTHNEEVLKNCPNARLFEFGTTWIKNYNFPEKEFSVSTLVGGKTMAPGHFLRHKLWYKEDKIRIPTKFYFSGNYSGNIENYNNNPILGDKKDPLFNSQFHIVIENTSRKHWFTEKLIDCLQTKSIPIYWGCPNIDEYFNTKGMFIVNDVKDIINVCNNINENTYDEMISYVEENYERSKEFLDISERLKTKIDLLINKIN